MKNKQDIIASSDLVGMLAPTNNDFNFWKEDDSGPIISSSSIQLIFPLWNCSEVSKFCLHLDYLFPESPNL